MKMKQLIVLILAIAMSALGLSAKGAETAASVLSKCAAKVSAAPSVEFKFVLSYGDTHTPCSILISKDKYRLSSGQMEVWYDGATQWTYATAQKELSITDPTPDELLECNPFAILNNYSKAYTCRRLSGPDHQIELVSKSKSATVRKAVMTVDPKTYLPSKLVVTLSNGRTFSAEVGTATIGKTMPSTAFKYDKAKFPASEIVDLR